MIQKRPVSYPTRRYMAFLSLTRGNTHVLNQNDFNEGYGVEVFLALIEPPFSLL